MRALLARLALVRPLAMALLAFCSPAPALAVEALDGRLQLHGYFEQQLRTISDDFDHDGFYLSQWASILNLELEADLAPDGWGPFSLIQGYVRTELRYNCVYTKLCGLSRPYTLYGDRADRAAKNFTNGRTSGFTGILPNPIDRSEPIQPNRRLAALTGIPPFRDLAALGGPDTELAIRRTLGPILDQQYAVKSFGGTLGPGTLALGPWNTGVTIHPIGQLAHQANPTQINPSSILPLRPGVPATASYRGGPQGLYIPSEALRDEKSEFGKFDQNFSQNELAWNYGASQDEYALREAYLDLEVLDGQLWFRLGKQSIVWGKTELFRTTDQFNPVDIGLTTLGSLEETRIPLWAARAIYSLYDVGPFQDVRVEGAINFDQFEPTDLGRCGEPYTVFLVCGKSFGLVAHGIVGTGLAGEVRPDDPWQNVSGLEGGARVEFRWDRFSFAITDYYGYSDNPTARNFNAYERNVDPLTGYPLDSRGQTYGANPNNITAPAGSAQAAAISNQALNFGSGNRQIYDVVCGVTVGIAGAALAVPGLQNECALSLFNSQVTVAGFPIAQALSLVLAGGSAGQLVLNTLTGLTTPVVVPLNADPDDGGGSGLNRVLTRQQEALLGCGPFYGTNCHTRGIDLYNAEASVLVQAFPMFERGPNGLTGPVATRIVNGRPYTLPGAGGPLSTVGRPYDPRVDGCVSPAYDGIAPAGYCSGAANLFDGTYTDFTGDPLGITVAVNAPNEMYVLSQNFLALLTGLGVSLDTTGQCSTADPTTCGLVRAVFGLAGTQRPELYAGGNGRFGRRDFIWSAGSEIELIYHKRNVLGFATDFAEDVTKTNWGVEFTWVNGENYANTKRLSGYSTNDTFNLTVSVDRPTFINFLNPNRTFLFNTQWFTRYINGFERGGVFAVNGPWSLLGTFSVFTGYFQDRLLPALTAVYDLRSNSGAGLMSLTYRFSEVFSISFGAATFFGKPEGVRIPLQQALVGNNGGSFRSQVKYDGLSAVSELDQFSLTLRYTF